MESQPDVPDGANLLVERAVVRIDIEMVAGGRATGENEFRRAHLRACVHAFVGEPRPNRVQGPQPIKQIHVLGGRNHSRQRLIEMVMGVDQTRENYVGPAQIEHFVRDGR